MASILADVPTHLADRLQPFLRQAHRPRVTPGDPDGPVSKFNGRPWLEPGADWPVCPTCDRAMALLLQLDLSSLPDAAAGQGLLQLFYCMNPDPRCEALNRASEPFSPSVVVRCLQPTAQGATAPAQRVQPRPVMLQNGLQVPQAVTGWDSFEDLPGPAELLALGLRPHPAAEASLATKRLGLPRLGDKAGGWPCWAQGMAYPRCPHCGADLVLVFQVDHHDLIGFRLGEPGTGHVTRCAAHLDVLAFAWASD